MLMRKYLFFILLFSQIAVAEKNFSKSPGLGQTADKSIVNSWNLDVFPTGEGLPTGFGTARSGKKVYEKYCLSCHGVEGSGDSAEELAGAIHSLTEDPPDKTIGTYWPYASTIFDFTRRSMPLNAPGSLNNGELYSVTAYLLFLNEIINENEVMNSQTLPKVKMPNRDGFINFYK